MTTTNRTSHPIALRDATVTDPFWASRQELVRTQVIPYQWNALNDNVPGAAPSYCMHNFKAAAAQNAEHHKEGKAFVPPKYTFRGFEALPDDPAHPDPDKFYGFVFQDTDFSKWIEAVGYSLTHHPDADLEATADTAIDIVCAAQLDNGYLDTYYILNGMDRHFTNLKDHHELYCFGHLTEGAIAYYQATGKRKLLDAACRFADYIDSRFGTADGKLHRLKTDWSMAGYTQGSYFVRTQLDTEVESQEAEIKALNESAVKSPVLGFAFDTSNVADKLTACIEVYNRYKAELLTGTLDPEEQVSAMMEEMRAAGFDDIVAEAQSQIDAYFAG